MGKTNQSDFPIDFVILWVDDNDPEWKEQRRRYAPKDHFLVDDGEARYRDWEMLRYWFRAVERFAPWVNRIYFVTCGHVPSWLNTDAEKLIHVKHSDYIPTEYLPTFSSHPIELCLNRIPELSEHFVYFNDDMFILRSIPKELFYRDGKPVHQARLHAIRPGKIGAIMPHIYLNNTEVINEHFDMHQVLRKDRDKWFSIPKNGVKTVMENMYCSQFKMFPGFKDEHLPVPILKSTMDTIWKLNGDRLDDTCRHRFRDVRDVSQYVGCQGRQPVCIPLLAAGKRKLCPGETRQSRRSLYDRRRQGETESSLQLCGRREVQPSVSERRGRHPQLRGISHGEGAAS